MICCKYCGRPTRRFLDTFCAECRNRSLEYESTFPFRFIKGLGWKRRMGVVTLPLALLLIVAWMRSFVVRDKIFIHSRFPVLYVASKDGQLSWERHSPLILEAPSDSVSAKALKDGPHNDWEPWEIHWNWRRECCGFLFGSGILSLSLDKFPPEERRWRIEPPPKRLVDVWMIPYWSIVIPLTLLSVRLLFSKPRQSIQKKITESVPVEVR